MRPVLCAEAYLPNKLTYMARFLPFLKNALEGRDRTMILEGATTYPAHGYFVDSDDGKVYDEPVLIVRILFSVLVNESTEEVTAKIRGLGQKLVRITDGQEVEFWVSVWQQTVHVFRPGNDDSLGNRDLLPGLTASIETAANEAK
jgi:hypothetical protein